MPLAGTPRLGENFWAAGVPRGATQMCSLRSSRYTRRYTRRQQKKYYRGKT